MYVSTENLMKNNENDNDRIWKMYKVEIII